jgi:hypothetical protein
VAFDDCRKAKHQGLAELAMRENGDCLYW